MATTQNTDIELVEGFSSKELDSFAKNISFMEDMASTNRLLQLVDAADPFTPRQEAVFTALGDARYERIGIHNKFLALLTEIGKGGDINEPLEKALSAIDAIKAIDIKLADIYSENAVAFCHANTEYALMTKAWYLRATKVTAYQNKFRLMEAVPTGADIRKDLFKRITAGA